MASSRISHSKRWHINRFFTNLIFDLGRSVCVWGAVAYGAERGLQLEVRADSDNALCFS